jgi:hypothetical protein
VADEAKEPAPDLLVRGGEMKPEHLLEAAERCYELEGFYGVSVWGLPGDTLEEAAKRMTAPYRVVRHARRVQVGAQYEINTRQDGHNSVIFPAPPTLESCGELADLFDGPIPNPALSGTAGKGGSNP